MIEEIYWNTYWSYCHNQFIEYNIKEHVAKNCIEIGWKIKKVQILKIDPFRSSWSQKSREIMEIQLNMLPETLNTKHIKIERKIQILYLFQNIQNYGILALLWWQSIHIWIYIISITNHSCLWAWFLLIVRCTWFNFK